MEIHIFSANVLNPVAWGTEMLSRPLEASPDGLALFLDPQATRRFSCGFSLVRSENGAWHGSGSELSNWATS